MASFRYKRIEFYQKHIYMYGSFDSNDIFL